MSPRPSHAPNLKQNDQYKSKLEDFELEDNRPPFYLSMAEIKLLGIAGVRV